MHRPRVQSFLIAYVLTPHILRPIIHVRNQAAAPLHLLAHTSPPPLPFLLLLQRTLLLSPLPLRCPPSLYNITLNIHLPLPLYAHRPRLFRSLCHHRHILPIQRSETYLSQSPWDILLPIPLLPLISLLQLRLEQSLWDTLLLIVLSPLIPLPRLPVASPHLLHQPRQEMELLRSKKKSCYAR